MSSGILFRSGENLANKLLQFIHDSQTVKSYTAYIKLDALDHLIMQSNNIEFICVRWKLDDLISGASDIEIYPYLKSRGITLYMNHRLHLKAWLNNKNRAFIGSANISNRALALGDNINFNYEIGTIIDEISFQDRLYFSKIEKESLLVTDRIYNYLKNIVQEKKDGLTETHEDNILNNIISDEKYYLRTSLPMSYDIDILYQIYNSGKAEDQVSLDCAIHDIALYSIELGLDYNNFIKILTANFFNHPFIKSFESKIAERGEIYFGEAKEWIQSKCTTVPTPRRWQLTDNVQILYRWIVYLGKKYTMNVPGRHSQRLMILNK